MTGFVSRRPGEIDEVALSPGQGCECPGDIHTSQWGLLETVLTSCPEVPAFAGMTVNP